MRRFVGIVILGSLGLCLPSVVAAGEPEKAVTDVSEKQGIKLSPKAQKTLGLALIPVQDAAHFKVPQSSLVYYEDHVGIYRLRDGWFKLVDIKDLQTGDQVVTQGVPLLRVAEMYAFRGED